MSLHAFCEIALGNLGGSTSKSVWVWDGLGAVHNMKPQQTT